MNDKLISLSAAVDLCRKKAKGYQPEMFGSDQECYTAKVVVTELAGEIRNLPPVDAETYIQQLEVSNGALQILMKKLEAKAPKWISVEERLPPVGNAVLVRVQSKRKTWQYIMTDMWSDGKWLENADSDWHIITHWMPLPEPPTEV